VLIRPSVHKADTAFFRIFPEPENNVSSLEVADGELASCLDIALERLSRIALLFSRPGLPAGYGTKFS